MTLEKWVRSGWLRHHETSREETQNLIGLVERNFTELEGELSPDWRFNISYNSLLSLCSILLYVAGYRAGHGESKHYRTIQSLEFTMDGKRKSDVAYLDACRKKRNTVEYDMAGTTTDKDADELVEFVKKFYDDVVDWLKENHQELC